MKKIIINIILFSCLNTFAQTLPTKSEVIGTMKLVNDYWINSHPNPGDNEWARAAYFTGNMAFYQVYPYERYYDYAFHWSNNHNWELSGNRYTRNADNQCCGQTYICLYELDTLPQDYKIAHIDTSISNMVKSFKRDDWWWIDALYMAMPIFTRLGVIKNDTTYFSKLYSLYSSTKYDRKLFNDSTNLWYRDETFAPPYKTPNGYDSYWSRGNGWVFAAHAKTIESLPLTDPHRDEYLNTYKLMAGALKNIQRSDGFWNVSLADSNDFGGPETSGTSFFTYGIAWGINHGILDSTIYYPVAVKAWNGLLNKAVHPDGKLGYIQGVGSNPSSSQPVTYESSADFGVGAFLLAGSEVVKLAKGEIPEPPLNIIDSIKPINSKSLFIFFNKELTISSAENLSNYRIESNLKIKEAILSENSKIVKLIFEEPEPGVYTLSLKNIITQNGYLVDTNFRYSFIYNNIIQVSASGYQQGSTNYPENTIDFDLSTRWSQEGDGEWILFELDTIRIVESIDIAFYNGDQRFSYFDIKLSMDGTSYSEVFSGQSGGKTTEPENFDFENTSARFVKITGHGNSASMWNSITWVKINTTDDQQVLIKKNEEDNFIVRIYPNPIQNKTLNFNLSESDPDKMTLSIIDMTGKEIYKQIVEKYCHNGPVSLALNLNKGLYFVKFENANNKEISKIIVEN